MAEKYGERERVRAMQSTTTEEVAAEVRAHCARQRVSQRDLAKVLGVSHATLFRRFSGEVAFDVEGTSRRRGISEPPAIGATPLPIRHRHELRGYRRSGGVPGSQADTH